MTARVYRFGPEFLQWFGLLGAALAWSVQLVLGVGATFARCGAANAVLGVDIKAWEVALMAAAIVLVLSAEASALRVLWQTRKDDHEDAPPDGRRHFFAVAAVLGNLIFLVIVVLSGTAVLVHDQCVPA